jgi:NADPH-dependent ferric siderophore reductase
MASKNSKLKAIWATVGVIATIVGLITAYPTLRAMYDEHVLDKPPLVPGTNAVLMSQDDYEQRQLKLRHDIEAELREAHQEDRARLQAELDAVNARLADLPKAVPVFIESKGIHSGLFF